MVPTNAMGLFFTIGDDFVDQAPGLCLLRGHEIIPLQSGLNRIIVLPGVGDIDLIQTALKLLRKFRVNHNVGRLALVTTRGLMHHDRGIGQRKPHVLGARGQKQ